MWSVGVGKEGEGMAVRIVQQEIIIINKIDREISQTYAGIIDQTPFEAIESTILAAFQ